MATDHGRRFTVLWTQRGREKHSAVMTQPEADKLAARLRTEDTADVSIREGEDKPMARHFDRLIETFQRW